MNSCNNDYGCNKGMNPYFDRTSECKTNENKLYDKLLTSMINQHGVKIIYYPVDYNIEYDKFFGEDMDRTILRRFNIKAYFELPEENESFSHFGIEGMDVFDMIIPILSFDTASKLKYNVTQSHPCHGTDYDKYVPTVGDIIEANYGDHVLYEVVNVLKTPNRFNLTEHSYKISVRVFRDEHLSFDTSTSGTMTNVISGAVDSPDILGINTQVDIEVSAVNYKSSLEDDSNDSIFGGW